MGNGKLTLVIRTTGEAADKIRIPEQTGCPDPADAIQTVFCAMDEEARERLKEKQGSGATVLDCAGLTPEEAANRALEEATGEWILFSKPEEQISDNLVKTVRTWTEKMPGAYPVILLPTIRDASGIHARMNTRRGFRKSGIYDLNQIGNISIPVSLTGALYRTETIRGKGVRFVANISSRCANGRFMADILIPDATVLYLEESEYHIPYDPTRRIRRQEAVKHESGESLRAAIEGPLEAGSDFAQQYAMTMMSPHLRRYATWTDILPEPEHLADIRAAVDSALVKISHEAILNTKGMELTQRAFLQREKMRLQPEETPASILSSEPDGDSRLTLEYTRGFDGNIYLICQRLLDAERFENVHPYMTVNGEKQSVLEDAKPLTFSMLGETVSGKLGFNAVIRPPKGAKKLTVTLGYEEDGKDEPVREITCAYTSALQPVRFQYAAFGDWLLRYRNGVITGRRNTAARRSAWEARYLLMMLWWARNPDGRQALKYRIHHLKTRKERAARPIWLINDRIGKADDNGEALFHYLLENRKDQVRPIYVLDSKSPDFERLKAIGEVIDPATPEFRQICLDAEVTAASHEIHEIMNPFGENTGLIADILNTRTVAFIRHGISKDDMSGYYNRHSGKFSMITAASRGEAASLSEPNYGLLPEQIHLIGLARFDLLYNAPKKKIVIMPTWRKYLVSKGVEGRSRRLVTGDTENSIYFRTYTALLNDKRLFDTAEKLGYQIIFVQHPAMRAANIRPFDADPRLETIEQAECYRDLFAEADLMVTDFSSVAFDFAYLYKPMIYFQPDADEFFGIHYKPGYFEYHRDGLGDVIEDPAELAAELIRYMENGCQLKEKYREKIDAFYPFRDQKNRERLADAISEYSRRARAGAKE